MYSQANGSAAPMAVESKVVDVASPSSPAHEPMDTTEGVPQVSVLGSALISEPGLQSTGPSSGAGGRFACVRSVRDAAWNVV